MEQKKYDLLVIGGGPGGYVAAIRGSQLGMKVGLVEREHLGGICLNWGCIPTKALLRSADIYEHLTHAEEFGLAVDNPRFDLDKIVQRSRKVSKQLSGGVKHLLKKNKVEVIDGTAAFHGGESVHVHHNGQHTHTLSASHTIIATGARARLLPGFTPDNKSLVTYHHAMIPETLPETLLVIGSGAIGAEFASFYCALGVQVTLVEVVDRVLPVEDHEISDFVGKALKKRGIEVLLNTMVHAPSIGKEGVTVTLEDRAKGSKETRRFSRAILAAGVVPNTEELGLESTKVVVGKGGIEIDGYCRTAHPGIYAIGDVAGAPMLAHKASHEAILCVEHLHGKTDVHPIDKSTVPGCTYCEPQVASVGMTERAAAEQGIPVKIGRFPFIGNGKAIALGATEGMIKTIFHAETGALIGAHLVGSEVTELISNFVLGMTLEATEAEFMHTIFPHPTLSEMLHESTLQAYGRAVHI